jgi:hypothetical protein
MDIIATFFVGLGSGQWKWAGPYLGRGKDEAAAGDNAMARCAVEHADQDIMFMTFASLKSAPEGEEAHAPNEKNHDLVCPPLPAREKGRR